MKPYLPEALRDAASRWQEPTARQAAAPERAGPAAAPDVAALKLRRLGAAAARERARALSLDARASARARPGADVLQSFGMERVIGTSDLRDIDFLELGIAVARSVARVHLPDGFGTGFLVGPALLITNNHVIGSLDEARGARAELDYQQNRSGALLPVQTFGTAPETFFLTSPELDFTVVALEPRADTGRALAEYPWNRLLADKGKIDVDDPVNVIQHPRGGLKQIAFRNNTVLRILDRYLQYTTDTEPGSSGAPCFNDLWEVVALHHSGVPRVDGAGRPLKKDGAPFQEGKDDPALIDWVGNEGVRISAIVEALRAAALAGQAAALRDQMLEAPPPNPVELARAADSSGGAPVATGGSGGVSPRPVQVQVGRAQGGSVTFSIPLQVTVSLGSPEPAGRQAGPATGAEKVEIDPDWSAREGYAEDFLGVEVKLPGLRPEAEQDLVPVDPAYRDAADPGLLRYHHYSLKLSASRRLAFFSAAAVDGDHRPDIGKRQGDKWYLDPRVPEDCQIGEEAYAGNALDRGHITRREDAAWGDDAEAAKKANDDTFHFTNCSPQHKLFNQGKDRWQGIENFLLARAKKDRRRLVVITGPVLGQGDPSYQHQGMDRPIRIPLEFWKLCLLRREDGSVALSAFVLSQADLIGDASGLEERFQPELYQVTLATLAAKVPYLDFPYPAAWDHLAQGGAPGTLEKARGARRIGSPADLALP